MSTNTVVNDLGTYSLKSSPDYPVDHRQEEKLTRSLELACRVLRTAVARLQALGTLERALATRQPAAGWIHHSDRGGQYASAAYVARLEAAGARISMSRKGNPYDNARAESFFKTLKSEEVELQEYQTVEEAAEHIGHFIEAVYNAKRLHSSLGYRPPNEFEAAQAAPGKD